MKLLIAETELEVRSYLDFALRRYGYAVEFASDGQEVLHCIQRGGDFSLVVLDAMMPRMDGIATLKEIRRMNQELPVIMLSAVSSPLRIVEAMKAGASDFLSKPITHDVLCQAIRKILDSPANGQEPDLQTSPGTIDDVCTPSSAWMARIETFLRRVGGSEVPVLLQGETGAGKEVIARRLHLRSLRADRPFLKLNCAALPPELVESELFGYQRGAFTGAIKDKPGKFEMADGGTLLLDEIGDMDVKLQAKLLQVLQDQSFDRLGGREMVKVNVRVMAATHCDLERAIREGHFREDLYYRLNVIKIQVPPLRERKDEILPLVQYFLKKHATGEAGLPPITPALRQALLAYDWPGNIRELENVTRKYLVLRDPDLLASELDSSHRIGPLPNGTPHAEPAPKLHVEGSGSHRRESAPVQERQRNSAPITEAAGRSERLETNEVPNPGASIFEQVNQARVEAETEAILSALNMTLWNRKQAAAMLKIDYKSLLYKMKKLGIGQTKSKSQGAAVG